MDSVRDVKLLAFSYLGFLILLFAASAIGDGALSDVVYYLSFILPLLLCELSLSRRDNPPKRPLGLNGGVAVALGIAPAAIAVVGIVSYLTSLLLGLFGMQNGTVITEGPLLALLKHAILPAILEEAIFRYMPMRMLSGYSSKVKLAVMTLVFALAHVSLFSIPYAACAGLIFGMVVIATGSVIPAVILHFLNNVSSLIYSWCKVNSTAEIIYYVIFGLLFVLSCIYIARNFKKLCAAFREKKTDGEITGFPKEIFAFLVPAAVMAVLSAGGGA